MLYFGRHFCEGSSIGVDFGGRANSKKKRGTVDSSTLKDTRSEEDRGGSSLLLACRSESRVVRWIEREAFQGVPFSVTNPGWAPARHARLGRMSLSFPITENMANLDLFNPAVCFDLSWKSNRREMLYWSDVVLISSVHC